MIWYISIEKCPEGLLLVTILKFDNKTPNENRKTIISKTTDKTVFFLKCNISGRNFEKNSIRNNILNIDLSLNMVSSEFGKPI